ncbi:MAG: hypothetical protein M3494_17030 [Actinomycetota bacterium]|nr:hypothetical protein [Rubrobacter sp.]MDQ3509685.1 hypothetical protein [Actinomycetota bacterium]
MPERGGSKAFPTPGDRGEKWTSPRPFGRFAASPRIQRRLVGREHPRPSAGGARYERVRGHAEDSSNSLEFGGNLPGAEAVESGSTPDSPERSVP